MSPFVRARSGVKVRAPGPRDTRTVLEFLDRNAAENVFLSYLVRRDGLERAGGSRAWHLADRDGLLCGVCAAIGNVVPAADGEEAARALAAAVGAIRPGTQSLVGERTCVSAMWDVLRGRSPRPRLIREEQPYYVLDRAALDRIPRVRVTALRLRLAAPEDLDVLVRASADMLREEILDDPWARDPAAFRAQVWRMIRERTIFVGEVQDRVVFKAHVNVRTPHAVQVSGVYTLPDHRARGHAGDAMRALSAKLLQEHPEVCLYVNGGNAAAIRTYESVGFRRIATFMSLFFDP